MTPSHSAGRSSIPANTRIGWRINEPIIGTSVEYRQTSGGVEHRETFSPDYLSLEASFRFGGNRKSPPSPSSPLPQRTATP